MYLPKSKYRTAMAVPNEYTLDGNPYVGPILITYSGKVYAGSAPNNITGELVAVFPTEDTIAAAVRGRRIPTSEEYASGSMIRYFRQDLRSMKIIELLPDVYNTEIENNVEYYRYATAFWILTGSLEDKKIEGKYTVPGVKSKNMGTIYSVESQLPGIITSKILYNSEEFVRDTL